MRYVLYINTPDDNGEIEEYYDDVEAMQRRKDKIYDMPWVNRDNLDVYASDENGNEVYLK